MAKGKDSVASTPTEIAYIIEKYLDTRDDLAPEIKHVCRVLYKGQTHTMSKWTEIINRRLSRPAAN